MLHSWICFVFDIQLYLLWMYLFERILFRSKLIGNNGVNATVILKSFTTNNSIHHFVLLVCKFVHHHCQGGLLNFFANSRGWEFTVLTVKFFASLRSPKYNSSLASYLLEFLVSLFPFFNSAWTILWWASFRSKRRLRCLWLLGKDQKVNCLSLTILRKHVGPLLVLLTKISI